jgi:orotidine-5'-phosphate decarboxylase
MPGHYGYRKLKVVTGSSPVATQLCHSVGVALAAKMRKTGEVTVVCFGEGATSKGDWHESLNLAGLHDLPVIFLCENNKYAISVPVPLQVAGGSVAARAEGYGIAGMEALIKTNRFIKENYPGIPIIWDAKRADIGNTNQGYVRAAVEIFQVDAMTVHPYLGQEALKPFLDNPDFGVIVLCHTSNPGAGEFQDLKTDGTELYKEVAARVSRFWNRSGNCGLVVGATYPDQLGEVRKIAGDLPILIPGVGAQGGDLEQTVLKGLTTGKDGIIINASRSILYASTGNDFARAAAAEASRMDSAIREIVETKS